MSSYEQVVESVQKNSWVRVWNRGCADVEEVLYYGGQTEGKTTGFFHKGVKQVFDALGYLGTDVVFFSHDDNGPYAVTIETEGSKTGQKMIAHTHRRGEEPVTSNLHRTTFAGKSMARSIGADNNRHYKAVCQLVINAAEAAESSGHPTEYGIDERVAMIGGGTCVYVRNNHEVEGILENLDFYFKSKNIGTSSLLDTIGPASWSPSQHEENEEYSVEVWSGSGRPGLQLYGWAGGEDGIGYLLHHGIASLESIGVGESGIGDYVIKGKSDTILDGDRELREVGFAEAIIGDAWASSNSQEALEAFLSVVDDRTCFENSLGIRSYFDHPEVLLAAFHAVYPTGFLAVGPHNIIQYAIDRGGTAVKVPFNLRYALESAGAPTAQMFIGAEITEFTYRKPLDFELKFMRKIENVLTKASLASPGVRYRVMTERPERGPDGQAMRGANTIAVWHEILVDDENEFELLVILLHEHRHIRSDASDNTEKFTNFADMDLARLAMAMSESRQ